MLYIKEQACLCSVNGRQAGVCGQLSGVSRSVTNHVRLRGLQGAGDGGGAPL